MKLATSALAIVLAWTTTPAAARSPLDAYYVCMVGNAALILKNQGYQRPDYTGPKKADSVFDGAYNKCASLRPKHLPETKEEALGDEIEMAISALATIGGGDKVEAAPPLVPMGPNKEKG